MKWNVKLPSLGEGINEVPITRVLVKPGDILKEDDIYITLEVYKADVEIPIPFSCKVKSIEAKQGEIVRIDDVIMIVDANPSKDIGKKDNIANIKAGLHWIRQKKVKNLCFSEKSKKYSFDEFVLLIDNAIQLADRFKDVSIYKLPDFIVEKIRTVLFETSLIFSRLEKFHYSASVVKDSECLRVVGFVRKNIHQTLRHFYESFFLACEWLDIEVPPETLSLEGAHEQVFVVHGHDVKMAKLVARFLESLDVEPIILSEREGKGDTIIEKLERYGSVGYAVVLLTPDDMGRMAGSGKKLYPRARQNVIFELGYFIGKLGRSRVSALYDKSVELPSDFRGVEYIEINQYDEWKQKLMNELQSARINIKSK